MKKLALISALIILIGETRANAGLSFGKTRLWQVPLPSQLSFRIEAIDPKLAKICSDYRDLVVSVPGKTEFDTEDIARLREETPSVFDKVFTAKFRLNMGSMAESISGAVQIANRSLETTGISAPLPFYTVRLSDVILPFASNSELSVTSQKDSLVGISKSLGLKPLAMAIAPTNGGWFFVVKGKDTACDLLQGNAFLEFETRAMSNPKVEDLNLIKDFYSKTAAASTTANEKKKSPVGRAALFGYKMDEVFKSFNLAGEQLADWVANIVETLFDENMQVKSSNGTSSSSASFSVDESVAATIKIQVGR